MASVKGKLDPEKRSELVDQGKALKARLAVLEAEVEMVEDALQREGQKLPNISHPDVSRPFFMCDMWSVWCGSFACVNMFST